MIEAYSYGHSNRKAYELADPAAVDALGMQDPAELFTSGIFFQPVPEPFSLKYVELFTDLQAL